MKTKNILLVSASILLVNSAFAGTTTKPAATPATKPVVTTTTTTTTPAANAQMAPTKDIVENAALSKDHTTLVSAVKAAGLVDTLKGAGPFTVFAPTNAAFGKLPAGTVDTLMKKENAPTLTKILTYHVIPGNITAKDMAAAIKKGKGTATWTTVAGGTLKAKMDGTKVVIVDEKGTKAIVTTADLAQKNGVIHVVDTVVQPN